MTVHEVCRKVNEYTLRGENCVQVVLLRFWKGVYSKRKEFASFRVDPFSEGIVVQLNRVEIVVFFVKMAENLASVPSPLKWSYNDIYKIYIRKDNEGDVSVRTCRIHYKRPFLSPHYQFYLRWIDAPGWLSVILQGR